MCISKLGCFDYLFPGCTGSAIADILDYRACEKINILLHDSDVIPEALELDVTDIFAVDLYRAVSNIVKSRNEAAESCLTAAGRTDQSNIRARFDIKIDVTKDSVRTVLIFERYIFKKDVAFNIGQIHCTFLVLDVRFDIKDLGKSLKARITVLELFCEINDYPYRLRECIDIQKECNEVRDLNKTVRDKDCTRNDYHDVYQENESSHAGLEQAKIKIAVLLSLQEGIITLLELRHLDLFIRKGLNNPDTRKIIFSSGIDLSNLLSVLLKCSPHPPVKEEYEDEHKRKQDESRCRQVLADTHQDNERTNDLNERYYDILRSVMQEFGYIKKVIGYPAH